MKNRRTEPEQSYRKGIDADIKSSQSKSIQKFQSLLRELFQFDCADLDFGIYRIMNYKRQVIEKFICTTLPETIDQKMGGGRSQ